MEFKVGDKVKILNTDFGNKDKIGVVENISGTVMIYFVKLDDCCQWSNASDLELVSMKFKVGDKVQVVAEHSAFSGDKGNVIENDGTDNLPIHVKFDDGGHVCWFYEDDLKVLHEEETSMKFKVGDKVQVSNSWEGRSGMIGKITDTDDDSSYSYTVTFEGNGNESFKEEELELAEQQFTKSDLKTGMGVVLRDGSKGHVLLGTEAGDVVRILDNGTWGDLAKYKDDLTSKSREAIDIVEVYRSKWSFMYLTDQVFGQECIFKREEPKPEPTKMTMKEINEHFGKAIEIVE